MYFESTNHGLYSNILEALARAKHLGVIEERFARHGKANLISERKATELFGARIVQKYHDCYGIPDATGTKANSTRQYSFTKLNELVEAEKIEEGVVKFELEVRRRQKSKCRDHVEQWLQKQEKLPTYVPPSAMEHPKEKIIVEL